MEDVASDCVEVWVVRHGQTSWNAESRLQGHLDIDIDATGQKQAAAVGQRLAEESVSFSAIYSSDLIRTRNTANAISSALDVDIKVDSRLRESNLGVLQGKRLPEIADDEDLSFILGSYRQDPSYKIPEGESGVMRFSRTVSALNAISARHVGKRIVIVTHGGVLQDFHQYIRAIPLSCHPSVSKPNCSVTILRARTSPASTVAPGPTPEVPTPSSPSPASSCYGETEGGKNTLWGRAFSEAHGLVLEWEVVKWACTRHLVEVAQPAGNHTDPGANLGTEKSERSKPLLVVAA